MVGLRAIKKSLIPTFSKMASWENWQRLPLRLAVRYLNLERPRRFPRMIQIEATSKCNLRCPSCSHSREKGSGQHLTGEELRRILDRLPFSPAKVRLSGIGEPLVNPHFLSLVDILAERGIKCDFITNGTLLTPRIREAILSRRNIDEVVISGDGASKTTFESLRLGADFEAWKHLVRCFFVEARQQRRQTLSITSSVVVSKQNLDEIGDIIRLHADLGFDKVALLAPIPVDDVAASLCLSQEEISRIRQEDLSALATALGVQISWASSLLPKWIRQCIQPWEYVFIRVGGGVAPCCAVFGSDKGAVIGNMLQQNFAEIWRGDRFRDFRRTCASGTNALCRPCPYYSW